MNRIRRAVNGAAEALRDLQIRLAWRIARARRTHADRDAGPDKDPDNDRDNDPDNTEFGRFLRQAGFPTDPDRDGDMMPYWLVSRRVPGPRMPEALESAYFRFRGRRQRDPERARLWRGYILKWAEMQADAPATEHIQVDPVPEDPTELERDCPASGGPVSPGAKIPGATIPGAESSSRRGPMHAHRLHRLVAAVAVVAAVGLGVWMLPVPGAADRTDLPSASALGIEQLERGSKSLVEQALRARYIETLHQVQRLRISSVGAGMDFERILLEGARLDVERAIDRHRQAGRVPPRLYLLLGKLSLLTEFETEGRRALARAANHGGAVGAEAEELLALLPE